MPAPINPKAKDETSEAEANSVASASGNKAPRKRRVFCDYCKKPNHTADGGGAMERVTEKNKKEKKE
ncbi:hypothetical protein FLAG1_07954 [Fusarium langsethiae]|uniref:Uncharacterized protein n=1 Tax=Fusarium langsethiae TaxID=179993 RepID=A0A0M9ESU9_FUSLA|nr:hypothetical protein FLAG1_07954 [Fusarium langsethiae]GKU05844.1 unnamed protein product [Fusarium langsethiae]GKU22042.1 unnamed protein product [Fusarium langsethiae]